MAPFSRSLAALFSAATVALGTACGGSMFAPGTPVTTGDWGGSHVAMTVTGTGATVQFDCAHGTIPQPLTVDGNGHFDAMGTYTQEGGPTPGSPVTVDARFSGTLHTTSQLDLSVTLTASSQTLNGFSLQRGTTPTLVRCQ